ncbi:MAG: M28 family peptidase [Terriglobales bacterium]
MTTPRLRTLGSRSATLLLLFLVAAGGVWSSAQSAAPAKSSAPAENYTALGQLWWSHIEVLASPKLQGRMTGSPGYMMAARYMAREYAAEGLKPAGTNGFFQSVSFVRVTLDPAHSSLAFVGSDGKSVSLYPGSARLRPVGRSGQAINAPAIFVGYAMSAPTAGYDDLKGLDLRGKIAVYVSGGPNAVPDPLRATMESQGERWAALRRAGAIGMIAIYNFPARARRPQPSRTRAAQAPQPTIELADPQLREGDGEQINAFLGAAAAAPLFAGTGHSLSQILADAHQGAALPHFALPGTIHAQVTYSQSRMTSPNVVAVLPGSDPVLRHQYVIVSAHLDHLGIRGGRLYPGALDNASGSASLIQIAHDFRVAHAHPRRSILFLSVCGEEEGELGSWYFAHHPTVPVASIVADINMDMYLPLFPLHLLQVQGLQESTLGEDVSAAARAVQVKAIVDEDPSANRFIRSDQFSFVQVGIPALAFKFGYVPGSQDQKIYDNWNRTRYHQPGDNLSQPNIDHAAAARFCRILYLLANKVADAASRPHWEPTSFFRTFATARR